MSPRRSVADAERTKLDIVSAAVDQASVEGVEGLTIGTLAARVGMSKAGVIGPFGTRQDLQLAVMDEAFTRFRHAVVDPALAKDIGLPRLRAVVDAWTRYVGHGPFPNGCFVTATSCELDGRPGALRDRLVAVVGQWEGFLLRELQAARAQGELAADVVPRDVLLTWTGLIMAANQQVQLLGKPAAATRARQLMLAQLRPA